MWTVKLYGRDFRRFIYFSKKSVFLDKKAKKLFAIVKIISKHFSIALLTLTFGDLMNRKELVEAILKSKELSHLTKKDADAFINNMLDTIKKSVKKGDDVSLVGFGTFTKVKRAARTGVNPATGEKIKIKAKTLPKFRPGKAWKEMF